MLLLAVLLVSAIPLAKGATTLAAPTVRLPNGDWEKTDSTAYPDSFSEHDPAGAGMLEFTDKTNYDVVRIFYEKAQVTSYTASQLKTEAEDLFNEIDVSDTRSLNDSGTANFAGVVAGYAEGYDANEESYKTELVFIKGDYYFNVHAYYDATIQSEDKVNSIINSIDVSGASVESLTSFPWLLIIAAVAIVVIILVVVVLMTRKKKTAQPQQNSQSLLA